MFNTRKKMLPAVIMISAMLIMSCGSTAADKDLASSEGTEQKEETIDLTKMPENEAFEKICEILTTPDDYVTKKLKVKGHVDYTESDTGEDVYATLTMENADGSDYHIIEFVLIPIYKYPDGYPETHTEAVIEGTFSLYKENDNWYPVLVNSIWDNSLLPSNSTEEQHVHEEIEEHQD